jgi:hypothetical protein
LQACWAQLLGQLVGWEPKRWLIALSGLGQKNRNNRKGEFPIKDSGHCSERLGEPIGLITLLPARQLPNDQSIDARGT